MPLDLSKRSVTATEASEHTTWKGAAFVVEALVLLVFLVAALAVFMTLFAGAAQRGRQDSALEQAVVIASNTAEQFSANPTGISASEQQGNFTVTCDVTPQKLGGGTLYQAKVHVLDSTGSEVYSLETSRYVSGVA